MNSRMEYELEVLRHVVFELRDQNEKLLQQQREMEDEMKKMRAEMILALRTIYQEVKKD